ncbi:MAG TPA: DUF86 domain-containing protein [Syntrophorhabdaceae bacterium]|nr:DUF86 domain-containing protein [Syntrophorhabdaceae bacterium]
MSKRDDTELLQDILECASRIVTYIDNIDYETFRHDLKTQDAVIRNLEIIGEAVKLVSGQTKKNHMDVPWKEIAGTRDKLIHDYFGVNIDVVWNVIKDDLPVLMTKLRNIKTIKHKT